MKEDIKVCVLTAHRKHEDCTPSTEVLDVFESHDDAEKAMKIALDAEKEIWINEFCIEEDGIEERIATDYASLHETFGNIEYTLFEITEKVIIPSHNKE